MFGSRVWCGIVNAEPKVEAFPPSHVRDRAPTNDDVRGPLRPGHRGFSTADLAAEVDSNTPPSPCQNDGLEGKSVRDRKDQASGGNFGQCIAVQTSSEFYALSLQPHRGEMIGASPSLFQLERNSISLLESRPRGAGEGLRQNAP